MQFWILKRRAAFVLSFSGKSTKDGLLTVENIFGETMKKGMN